MYRHHQKRYPVLTFLPQQRALLAAWRLKEKSQKLKTIPLYVSKNNVRLTDRVSALLLKFMLGHCFSKIAHLVV